jgi:hypothetical protein
LTAAAAVGTARVAQGAILRGYVEVCMRERLRVRSPIALVLILWLGSAAAFAQQNAQGQK